MEEKFNEATGNRPGGDRLIDAPFVISDLQAHMKQITEEDAFFKNDRNAITLFKSNGLSLVLVALRATAEMNTPEPTGNVAIVQVMSGSLQMEIEGTTSSISNQQVISFHAQSQYNILAVEDTIFLLTYCHQ